MQKPFNLTFYFIILLFFSSAVFAGSSQSLPVITLNDTNKTPFTTKSHDGFVDVMLIEAFKRAGYKYQTVRLPPERGLLSANDGVLDGEVNRISGIEKKYKNLRRVPEKIRDSDFCVLSKNANIVNRPQELKKHVVGYVKGWKIYEKMMEHSSNIITADSPRQLFRLLKIGRIDAALYTCLQGAILAKEFKIEGIKVLEPLLKQRGMYLYLNKKHEQMVPVLNRALQDIKQEGLYDLWYKEKILPYVRSLQG